MRLRVYRAADMRAAMAQLRAELGAEAVILDSRRVAGGIELTAARDGRGEPAAPLGPDEPLLILPSGGGGRMAPPPPPSLSPALHWHRAPEALAGLLAGPEEGLAGRLGAGLSFAPLPDGMARPVMLVGPPGAGKTLTCAKLATQALLAGRPPLVVTTDDARAGATEHLAAVTRLLHLPLAVAPKPAALAKALARRAPGQPVLIDTAGQDPRLPAPALTALLAAAEAEPLVVLPAGLDAEEAAALASGFAAFGATLLLPSRLDLPARLGGVLAAAAAGLALTAAGIGRSPADGLAPLDAARLAGRLLRGPAAWREDAA
jgi:flagellar biosynthesis protein FlhF